MNNNTTPELKPKVAIIGCGNVGMRYAYALIIRGLARQVVLIDVDRKKAEGEAMDLSHGAPYISPVEIAAGDYSDMANSDIVVITAGKGQRPGQTRLDLVKANVELYRKLIPEVTANAPSAIYLIVSNPVDILSYAAWKFSGKPAHEVIGSGTVLDTARLRFLLGKHCGIDPHNIHSYILGEHGDSEFAVWSRAMIGGVLFEDYCPLCRNSAVCDAEKERNEIFSEVRDSAYKIIERKGETSYGIGLALVRITRAILNNENSVMPVSSLVENKYGINDVYLSLPAVIARRGIKEILHIKFSDKEEQDLKHSAALLKETLKAAGLN
ncbi:MAG: L-lactate dehydrogenase [Elusimicrobia bacterium RIFOXYA2_FULL_50_26]|nr:MAG: L-lactate dehydrogenase [Elusimicrobia bacterium RIFOXYA2_FULL_50_26]OGS24874.1 MAG: L-lactate dehydrogenase [Elusimicrobia bacterium RIFOXYB2_FULL_50_12]